MKRMFAVIAALFLLFSLSPAQQPAEQKPVPKITYIKAGRLFDGTGEDRKSVV